MNGRRAISGDVLEQWSASAFLVAGGLLLITTTVNGVEVFASIDTQRGSLLLLEGFTGFGGVVLSFVGLLGLYPRLSAARPRTARAGLLLAVGPTLFFAVVLVTCSILAPVMGFPSLKTLVPSFAMIFGGILLPFAVSLALFGVASFGAGVPSRPVAGSLLVMAVAWFAFFGTTWLYAPNTPVWVTFVQTLAMAAPMTFIGYRLRSDTAWADRSVASAVPNG